MKESEVLTSAASIVESLAKVNDNNIDFQGVAKFLFNLAKVYKEVKECQSNSIVS